ncbi:hypothetical protein [Arthrobacter sp. ISL-28]|uniref:hypothetical protein n=1 Tax=Arthrobacter sp. ISL-28 TaxID=2819108 RepID=UPI0037C073D5
MVAGANYGQGSSREHAAITPRYLGLRAVVAISFARIHWQNLANFGVLALEFTNAADHDRIQQDDVLLLTGTREALVTGTAILVHNKTRDEAYPVRHSLSTRQIDMLLAGGLIPWLRERRAQDTPTNPRTFAHGSAIPRRSSISGRSHEALRQQKASTLKEGRNRPQEKLPTNTA